jgi:hypothetical protein
MTEKQQQYSITEKDIDAFLDYVEDDDNHTEEKYKNARGLAAKIRGTSAITLTPALQDYYATKSQQASKPVNQLVLSDLTALLKKRVAREDSRVFKEIEYERLGKR